MRNIYLCIHTYLPYELFYQRSVVELSQIGHISPPIKLCDVDVVDVEAALCCIMFILHILIFISIYIYIFCLTSSQKTKLQYRSGGSGRHTYKRGSAAFGRWSPFIGSFIGALLSQMRSDKINKHK